MKDTAEEQVFFNTEKFLEDLAKTCATAIKSIDMEMFILEKDHLSERIMQYLKEAAKRGVVVRILVDGIGSFGWIFQELECLQQKNFSVRVFNPIKIWFFNGRWNKRNHRKTIIVDNKIAYIGSFNFSKRYIGWRETVIRIKNHLLPLIQRLFDYTWSNAKYFLDRDKRQFSDLEDILLNSKEVYTTQSSALKKKYRKEFLKSIGEAKDRVWLMTPYFNPPRFLLKALVNAATKGVDVRLVLPRILDLPFLRWLAQLHYPMLLSAGIKIYEYKPSVLHAKMHLMDQQAMVGTGNLNYRSFMRDIELNIVCEDPNVVKQIAEQFVKDMSASELIQEGSIFPWYKQLIGRLLFSFKTSF